MANAYSRIVFHKRSISEKAMSQCHSYMQFKSKILANEKHDQFFYETLLLFCCKALKDAFEVSDLPKLEEEVSRLFRSNAFNITERRLHEEKRVAMFPALAEFQTKNPDHSEIRAKMQKRALVPKNSANIPFDRTKSEIRPLFNRLTAHGAVACRSPMVSLIFPSTKDKIRQYHDESSKVRGGVGKSVSTAHIARKELEQIVMTESRMRQPNNYFNLD